MKKIQKLLCAAAGGICFALGMLGVLLPILPATPFFLLAAVLFARGSNTFHQRFKKSNIYKNYVEKAMHKKLMTGKEKAKMMLVLGILFFVGILFSPVWYAKVLIGVIAAVHIYYILFKIKTQKPSTVVEG